MATATLPSRSSRSARKSSANRPNGDGGSLFDAHDSLGQRVLLEFVKPDASGPKLKIDKDAGIIYGVKILGRYSKNQHGLREAENGSEYAPQGMEAARSLYEGMKVRTNHPDRRDARAERDIDDTFGQLRNVRMESDELRGDLHYLKSHPLANRVVEDVERGLGVYGLSHNASAASERFDRANKRLVIEQIGEVRSVDLVDKPATNRNLWESHSEPTNVQKPPVKFTLRSILESQRTRFSKNRLMWMDRLLEDDYMKQPLSEEGEMDAGSAADPADAMRTAFESSIQAIVTSALSGDTDMKEALKKIGDMLKTHERLNSKAEPEEPAVEESEDPPAAKKDDADKKSDKEKTESLRVENEKLKRKDACRDLCESLGFTPTKDQLAALLEISTETVRKTTAETFKAAIAGGAGGGSTQGGKKPKSFLPGRDTLESQGGSTGGTPKLPKELGGRIAFLRRG